ncbi:hypothetical protein DAPPUDRAFT_107043 [Daphnia pulex]|uniref:Uncharacterized protein n=1 Tax=Daphnia pulex TaxID=6669 RepID=E9GVS4_DAPPU|nr:hypothetical protein DAPPUDRAFT_107043 [Daphnia pulex]|eukprot:EFX76461.1 hypothetical protein DAPPUDRAFT_107043 [Daphnia pulex]
MTVPVYFVTALLLTSWIFLIMPTQAAPNYFRSPQQLKFPAVPKELLEDGENTVKRVEKPSASNQSTEGAKFKEKALRLTESVVGIGVDSLADIMTGVSNVLNSRSNIDDVDRFTAVFNSLFHSKRGGYNVKNYYNIVSRVIIFDILAMIFRIWEDRLKNRQASVEALRAQQESDSPIEETLEALSEVNAKLTLVKDGLNRLVRRKDIRRMGLAALKQGFEKKTIYLHSGPDGLDDDSDEEEEDEDEEPVDEDETEYANSSQGQTVTLDKTRILVF